MSLAIICSYYLQFLQDSYRTLAFSTALSIARSFLLIPMAWLVQNAFDKIIPAGDIFHIAQTGLLLVLLQLTHSSVGLWSKYKSTCVARTVTKGVINTIFESLYLLSRTYFNTTDWGRFHSRLIHNIDCTEKFSEALLAQVLPASILTVILGSFLWYLNSVLFLVLMTITPLLWVSYRKTSSSSIKNTKLYWRSRHTVNQGILFLIQMMDLIHIQTAKDQESNRQQAAVAEFCLLSQKHAWGRTLHSGIQETLLIISGVVVLVVGGSAVAKNQMTLGDLMAFYAGVLLIKPSLQAIMANIPTLRDGIVAITDLYHLQVTEEHQPYTGVDRKAFQGMISFKGVSFQYGAQAILQNVNFTLTPGTISVVVGSNGSGKSTLIYLLLGFYRPQNGYLSADNHRYDELDILHLRRHIGVVMQEPFLFPGTVQENIAYGYPHASVEDVIHAASLATAHDFIQKLPKSYETLIGEKGLLLSGGQRQRIAIARALLRKPKLLILDEPTNHLDEQATCTLLQTLKQQDNMPTTLIISHDSRFLSLADQVLYLYGHQLHLHPEFVMSKHQDSPEVTSYAH